MKTSELNNSVVVIPEKLERLDDAEYKKILFEAINSSSDTVVLDCKFLTRPTSRHVYLLWRSLQECEEQKIKVRLSNVSLQLVRVLVVLDLYDLFMSYGSPLTCKISQQEEDTFTLKSAADDIRISFSPSEDEIDKSMDDFKKYLERLEIPRTTGYDLITVFYEIATNIRLHSKTESDEIVEFLATPAFDRIRMRFDYGGIEFDPSTKNESYSPEKSAAERKINGYGLVIINKMVDEIKYQRTENEKNRLILEKKWN